MLKEIPIPHNLIGTLEKYQKYGFFWMIDRLEKHKACLLADDMGLGKTLQIISTLLHYKNSGKIDANNKALIIVPKTLVNNWVSECNKFAPSLNPQIYTPETFKNAEIVLITYQKARQCANIFSTIKPFLLILDEAQHIKNLDATQSKIIKSFPANYKIAVTGTPLENNLTDLVSICDFLGLVNKDLLKLIKDMDIFYRPIKAKFEPQFRQYCKKFFKPYILRRIKNKEILNLPPIKIHDVFCVLSASQKREFYNLLGADYNKDYRTLLKEHGFATLNSIRSIANYAELSKEVFSDKNHSNKFRKLLHIIKNMRSDDKMLIFTTSIPTVLRTIKLLDDKINIKALGLSGKNTITQRSRIIKQFEQSKDLNILLISTKVGGTGINLTSANIVIHFDLWWNPMVEDQATARAYRRNQTKEVTVYRFIVKDTFEESINSLLLQKRRLFTDVMNAYTTNFLPEIDDPIDMNYHLTKQLLPIFEEYFILQHKCKENKTYRNKLFADYYKENAIPSETVSNAKMGPQLDMVSFYETLKKLYKKFRK